MSLDSVRRALGGKARVLFPIASLALTALILTGPLFGGVLAFLHEAAFARFCLFWCLGACIVLAMSWRRLRPSVAASISVAACILVSAAYHFVCDYAAGLAVGAAAFFFSCLSGAILGALAGTWLIYVVMYSGNGKW